MINIRYHIVSITAIFLALGIGTLLGSTFLDRATVDQLDRNIRNAEGRINETQAANADLEERLDEANARDLALIEASETLLDGQLTDRPVLLVVAPGVDRGSLDTLRRILANADADLRGSLTLRDDLAFADGVDGELAAALDLDEDDPEAAREEVNDLLLEAMVAAGAPADPEPGDDEEPGPGDEEPDAGTTSTEPGATTTVPGAPTVPGDTTTTAPGPTTVPGDTTTSTTTTTAPEDGAEGEEEGTEDPALPDGSQPEVLSALIEAELVGLDPGPEDTPDDPVLERTGYQYVFVTQPGLDEEADELLLDLLPSEQTDPPLPAVVVSATVPDGGTEDVGDTAVAQIRGDSARSGLYDTVDDIDRYLGLTSVVTILRSDAGTAAGHYGQGEGATALAPSGR
jgi:hypothetical protein